MTQLKEKTIKTKKRRQSPKHVWNAKFSRILGVVTMIVLTRTRNSHEALRKALKVANADRTIGHFQSLEYKGTVDAQ